MAKTLFTIAMRRGVSFSKTTDELLGADVSIAIDIVVSQKSLELDFLGEDSKGSEGLLKFARVELSVAVKVHVAEDDLESAESNTTLLLDSQLELEFQLTDHNVLIHTVEGHGDEYCTK